MTATKSPPSRSVHPTELYKTPPPVFGHDALALFGFAPNYVNLNHGRCPISRQGLLCHSFAGSYGSLPLTVRAFCDELTDEVESNPDKFIRVDCINYLTNVRERIAKFIGAETDECVIVNNTSHGIATVLRNFTFNEGDILVGGVATVKSATLLCGLTFLLSNNDISFCVPNAQASRRSSPSSHVVDIQP